MTTDKVQTEFPCVMGAGGELILSREARDYLGGIDEGTKLLVSFEKGRSRLAHNRFFRVSAALFGHIREDDQDQPWAGSLETWRKHALIRSGWADASVTIAATEAECVRAVNLAQQLCGYAVSSRKMDSETSYWSLTVWTAKSQSLTAMKSAQFMKSAEDAETWMRQQVDVWEDV